jgi:hypothetical protein
MPGVKKKEKLQLSVKNLLEPKTKKINPVSDSPTTVLAVALTLLLMGDDTIMI